MDILLYLIPIALTLGLLWLAGFLWALKGGQFDDPEGAATRILMDDNGNLPPELRNANEKSPPIT